MRDLVLRSGVRTALFGGDDVTDLDGFAALDRARRTRASSTTPCAWACARTRGRREILEQADLVVDGIEGFQRVLAELDAA